MANQKVSALSNKSSLAGTEYVMIVDDPAGTPTSKRTTVKGIMDYTHRVKRVSAGSGLVDLTTGRAAGITSQYGAYSTYSLSKSIDDSIASGNGWIQNSSAVPGWWQIDLGVTRKVQQIKIYIQTAGMDGSNYMQRFSLECSTDGNNWTTLYTSSADESTLTWLNPTITPTVARYIRINMTKVPGSAYGGFSEIEVLAGGLCVYGLLPYQKIEFRTSEGTLVSSATVLLDQTMAELPLSGNTGGYIVVYDPHDDTIPMATSITYNDLNDNDIFTFI